MKRLILALLLASSAAFAEEPYCLRVDAPATVALGVPFTVTVSALGYFGKVVDYSAEASIWASDSTIGSYGYVYLQHGVATFTMSFTAVCRHTIEVHDRNRYSLEGEASVLVHGGTLVISGPSTSPANTPFSIEVRAIAGESSRYLHGVKLTGTCPLAYSEYTGPLTVTMSTPGKQMIYATTDQCDDTTAEFPILIEPPTAGTATHFSVDLQQTGAVAGTYMPIRITALDGSNHSAPYRGSVCIDTSEREERDSRYFDGTSAVLDSVFWTGRAGDWQMTVHDCQLPWISGTASYSVVCGPDDLVLSYLAPFCPARGMIEARGWTGVEGTAADCYEWITPNGRQTTCGHWEWLGGPHPEWVPGNRLEISIGGKYSVTAPGKCHQVGSATITFLDEARISAPLTVEPRSSGNMAEVTPMQGCTYSWSIANGTISSGADRSIVRFTAGDSDSVTLTVTIARVDWPHCAYTTERAIRVAPNAPTAVLPASLSICGAGTLDVPITLTGRPPFTLGWSDGVVQNGINSTTAIRSFDVAGSTVLSISSVSDTNGVGAPSDPVQLFVDTPPSIDMQPRNAFITPGEKATFSVEAAGTNLHYTWFFVPDVGPLMPVGDDDPSFTTSWPVTKRETYLVRVSNACGAVDSVQVTAVPLLRRRATGR